MFRYPGDAGYSDAKAVLADYLDRKINPDSASDPGAKLLRKELSRLLQGPDDAFIKVTGEPGSHDWESGVPQLPKLKEAFSAYIKEIDEGKL
jgi:hypothetical protein